MVRNCWTARLLLGLCGLASVGLLAAEEKKELIEGGLRVYVVHDRRNDKEPIPDDVKSCDLVQQVKARTRLKTELNRTGTFLCPISENGLYPTLAIFSRTIPAGLDEPLSQLLKQADTALSSTDEKNVRYTDYRSSRLGVFGVFLTLVQDLPEDQERDKSIGTVCKLGSEAKLKKVLLGVAEGTLMKDGNAIPNPSLAPLAIDANDDTVVIFYDRLEVIKRWKFSKDKPLTAEDVTAILSAVDQRLLKKKK